MKVRMLVAFVVLAAGVARAADPAPLDRAELDKRAAKAAHDSSKLGSELWAAGEIEGCYRLYQGSLLALAPMLDHRPKLAELAKEKLEAAKNQRAEKGAFTLRQGLDAIQKECSGEGEAVGARPPAKNSLWVRLGGEKTVKAVIHDLIDAALKDPKVNFTRDGTYKIEGKTRTELEERLVELISEVGRGPLEYTGRDVKKLHASMKITGEEFDAMVGHLDETLKKNKVDDDAAAELVKAVKLIKSYIVAP